MKRPSTPLFTPDRLRSIGFYGLLLATFAAYNWLKWALVSRHDPPLFLWAVIAVWVGSWLLSLEKVETVLGRFNLDGAGGWRTTRAERIRRLAPLPFLVVAATDLSFLARDLWRLGDLPRAFVATAMASALLVWMARHALKVWRVRVELRIDEDGVFAPAWRRAFAWTEIAFAVQPRGTRDLRLALTPEAAERAGRAALLTTPLAPTGLDPNEALRALRALRPDLPIEPWTSNGVVLPIRGATDVGDTVEVRTYG